MKRVCAERQIQGADSHPKSGVICGTPTCNNPGVIWLEKDEALKHWHTAAENESFGFRQTPPKCRHSKSVQDFCETLVATRMSRDDIRRQLALLRDEARALADLPSVPLEQVDEWRNRTTIVLTELFGPDSEPARDFSRIRFEYTDVIDAAERVIRADAAKQDVDIDGHSIRLPPASEALRQGLHQAAELLTSLMI